MKFVIALLLLTSTSAVRLNKTDIRGPSTDGPTAGVANGVHNNAPAPIPGPFKATAAAAPPALAQKADIRGPTTDGPTAGVANGVHNNAPAPIPGPFKAAAAAAPPALAQKTDIRGPSTDGPTAGVANGVHNNAPAPIPGPFKASALSQIKGDVLATGNASYSSHAVLDDVLHQDRKQKIQSVAGPDVTDQIGASVHASAMEGGDAMPGDKRDIIGPFPKSFIPVYGKSTTKDAGDIAAEASKEAGKKINEADAAKAADAAKLAAEIAKEDEAKAAADIKALKASEPATMAGKEAKAAKLAAAEATQATKQDEKVKEAVAATEKEKPELAEEKK